MSNKRSGRTQTNGDEDVSSDRGGDQKAARAANRKPHESGPSNNQNKDAPSKPQEIFLGNYTTAANNAMESMQDTQKHLGELAVQYRRHLQEITDIAKKGQTYVDLHEQIRLKELKISEQNIAIRSMGDAYHEHETELVKKKKAIDEEMEAVKKEKLDITKKKEAAEKRQITAEAVAKVKVEEESIKLQNKFDEKLKGAKKTLEANSQKQKVENEKQLATLQDENEKLLAKAKEYQKQIDAQEKELHKAREEINDNTIVKDSLKEKINKLNDKLKSMENEFELNNHTPDH